MIAGWANIDHSKASAGSMSTSMSGGGNTADQGCEVVDGMIIGQPALSGGPPRRPSDECNLTITGLHPNTTTT